jgi:hypothetical protein
LIFYFIDLRINITIPTESQHSSDYGSTFILTSVIQQPTPFDIFSTDEIQKASAYMTETYFLSSSKQTRDGQELTRAPFCFAFDTVKTGTDFFGWLEGEIETTVGTHPDDDGYVHLRRTLALPPDFFFR